MCSDWLQDEDGMRPACAGERARTRESESERERHRERERENGCVVCVWMCVWCVVCVVCVCVCVCVCVPGDDEVMAPGGADELESIAEQLPPRACICIYTGMRTCI